MSLTRRRALTLATAIALAPGAAVAEPLPPPIFAEFGHRSPVRADYDQAIDKGADFLVAPIVAAKDAGLFVAPDVELSAFTDVASQPTFAERKRQAVVDGQSVSGWFASDFTAAELKALATGPAPRGRAAAASARPTLLTIEDVIEIARAGSVRQARVIGVCVLLVHPVFFGAEELALEPRLARAIQLAGFDSKAAAMMAASRDPASLKTLAGLSRVRRIQTVDPAGGPADPAAPRFLAMVQPDGLEMTLGWADAIAPDASLLIRAAPKGPPTPTDLAAAAHAARLKVIARVGLTGAQGTGDLRTRLTAVFLAGADGVMCEDVGAAVRARGAALDRLTPRA